MFYMFLQLFYQVIACFRLPSVVQYNCCFDNHAANFVGNAGDGTFNNGGMGHQCTFYLKRTDAVAAAFDNIVGTTYKPIIPIFISPSNVAGVIYAVVPRLVGKCFITIILFEKA